MLQGHHSAQRPAEAPLFAFTHPVKGFFQYKMTDG